MVKRDGCHVDTIYLSVTQSCPPTVSEVSVHLGDYGHNQDKCESVNDGANVATRRQRTSVSSSLVLQRPPIPRSW